MRGQRSECECICCDLLIELIARNCRSDVEPHALVMAVYDGLAGTSRDAALCAAHAASLTRMLKTIGEVGQKKSSKRKP